MNISTAKLLALVGLIPLSCKGFTFQARWQTNTCFLSSLFHEHHQKQQQQQQKRRCLHHLASTKKDDDDDEEPELIPAMSEQQKQQQQQLRQQQQQQGGGSEKSLLEGNRREPSVQEIGIMDEMITKLLVAKPYELPNAIARAVRVVSSPKFFLRIAERADMTKDPVEKERLSNLATNLVSTLEAAVSTAEDKLEERAKDVENVVKAAAEPESGEFLVPLSSDRVDAMRKALLKLDFNDLDEGFLSTIDAWMNKSHQDGMDGMVGILQKLLQMYAGEAILRARQQLQAEVGSILSGTKPSTDDDKEAAAAAAAAASASDSPASTLLEKLLTMDTELWDMELRQTVGNNNNNNNNSNDESSSSLSRALKSEIQKTMEGVVLGLENGSMAQRIQAEYIRELMSRIDNIVEK